MIENQRYLLRFRCQSQRKIRLLRNIVVAVLTILTTISLQSNVAVAAIGFNHQAWDPNTNAWVEGQPKGYTEGEVAPFRVTVTGAPGDVGSTVEFSICLDLDRASSGGIAFTDTAYWKTDYSPPSPPADGELSAAQP